MQLSYAFLADGAQVENGKVYVLGGGITVLWRQAFPAGLGCTVVFSVAYNNTEVGQERPFGMHINNADGQAVAPPLEGKFRLPPRDERIPASVPLEAAFAIDIAGNVPIVPEPGNYVIELLLDGNHVKSLPFAAVAIPAPDG